MKNILMVLAAFVVGYFAWTSMSGPKTYDDCMLQEMRGQEASMYGTAVDACGRRFHRETQIFVQGGDWSWVGDTGFQYISFGPSILEEYEISRGRFSFSNYSCKESTAAAFAATDWQVASDNVFGFRTDNQGAKCARIDSLFGYRR